MKRKKSGFVVEKKGDRIMSQNQSTENLTLKKDALGFKDVLVYGLLFMVSMAPITVFGEVSQASDNMVPLVYLVACIAMVFTGLSYYHYAKKFPMSGSVYTYITKGINPFVGFMGGWLILMDYFFIPALIYKSGAIYITDAVGGQWWIWGLLMIAVVTVVNLMGIDNMSKLDWVFFALQVIAVIIIIALGIKFISGGGGYGEFSLDPIYRPGQLTPSFIATACALACLSFLGFDGISTLAEETIKPEKTIGPAIIAAIVVAGLIFIVETYVVELYWGGKDPSVFEPAMGFYQVFDSFAPQWVYTMIQVVYIAAIFVNVVVAQASAARIVFGMARDKSLPGVFSKIHPKTRSPYMATLAICIISLIVIFIPFDTIVLLVNLGAIISFIALDLSVIWHFFIKEKQRKTVLQWVLYLICPIIGAVILAFVLTGFSKITYIVGICWFVLGLIILGVRTKGFKVPPGEIDM